jgi:hypothetical protein
LPLSHVNGFEIAPAGVAGIETIFSVFIGIVGLRTSVIAEWTPDTNICPFAIAAGTQQGA